MSNQLNGCSLFLYQKEMIKLANKPSKRNVSKFGIDELQDLKNIDSVFKEAESLYKSNQIETVNPNYININGTNYPTHAIEMTDHAYKRANERFNISDRKQAVTYFRGWLKGSEFVSEIYCEDSGKLGYLFGNKGIAIVTSTDMKRIVTVYKREFITYEPLKRQIYNLHKRKLNNYERQEKAKVRRLAMLELESNVEVAQLKLRQIKSKSPSVKMSCEARINAISHSLSEYRNDIKQIQTEKRKVARSMVSLI